MKTKKIYKILQKNYRRFYALAKNVYITVLRSNTVIFIDLKI
jgi:hypothetical protein